MNDKKPLNNFFYLCAVPKECTPLRNDPQKKTKPTAVMRFAVEAGAVFFEGGARTPLTTSHHVGVSGGGWTTRVTPTWCERGPGVMANV